LMEPFQQQNILKKPGLMWVYSAQLEHELPGKAHQYTLVFKFWNDAIMVNIITKIPLLGDWSHPILESCISTLQFHKVPGTPEALMEGPKLIENDFSKHTHHTSKSMNEMQLHGIDSFGFTWNFELNSTSPRCYFYEYTAEYPRDKDALIQKISRWQENVFFSL